MQEFGALWFIWLMHAGIAAVLSTPVVFFGRKRVHWQWWELSAFIIPFAVWALLMFSDLSTGRKSLSNLAEPVYFSVAYPLAAAMRIFIGTRVRERASAGGLILGLCVLAAVMFFLVPSLPE
jgi:hypothetical protein